MKLEPIETIGPDSTTDRVERGFYGVATTDAWNLDRYLLGVLRNGLVNLVTESKTWPDSDEYPTYESWIAELERRVRQAELLLDAEQIRSDILEHTIGEIHGIISDRYEVYYERPEREGEYLEQLDSFGVLERAVQKDLFGWLGRNLHYLWN